MRPQDSRAVACASPPLSTAASRRLLFVRIDSLGDAKVGAHQSRFVGTISSAVMRR